MFESIAAIDIGTSSIKLVTVKTGFRDFQLKAFNYEEINPDIENRTEAISSALIKIMEEEDLEGHRVITNLPMEMEIIRTISFPFSDVEKIAEAIPYEAEENIPFKIDDLILDFQSLKSNKDSEGRILLAAGRKDTLKDYLHPLGENGLQPIRMGMEANALYECYRYFNKIENESVIQIDIGHHKTILNFISNNHLLFTRCVTVGVGDMVKSVATAKKLSNGEAIKLFENLNLDLTSLENNIQREHYRTLGISRPQLKKIYQDSLDIAESLVEQIIITMKALIAECGEIVFNRALISGGGSNISGIGTLISRELDIPVDGLPFLEDYKERQIRSQFPIAFGTVLAYINRRRSSINFLKGEFIPDIASESRKIYYLSGGFAILAFILLLINLILSAILTARSNSQYNRILAERYTRYFNAREVSEDPIGDAKKLINKQKKELDAIMKLVPEKGSFLDVMKEILAYFPQEGSFTLNNLVFNESIVMIEGISTSSSSIDAFKENLIKTKKYDSVTINIRQSRQDEVRFAMNIKRKVTPEKKSD